MQCALSLPCSCAPLRAFSSVPPRIPRHSLISLPKRRSRVISLANSTDPQNEVDDGRIGEFCSIDETGKRRKPMTVGEMEQEFLAALSAYYFDGKPAISDEEFETLKDELLWNGSKVAILSPNELKFLEATQSFYKGQPIMSDEDYDSLKNELKTNASVISAEGPRCSIRTQTMYADAKPDYLRMLVLNFPAVLLVLGFLFAIDDVTGFEITEAIELPPPYGTALLWGVLLPTIFVLASSITNLAFKDSIVLKGPCPNCSAENFTYFGDILTVPGNRGSNVVECVSCNAGLTFDERKRIIVVSESAEEKKKKAEAAAAKKAASAAKKAAKAKSKAKTA